MEPTKNFFIKAHILIIAIPIFAHANILDQPEKCWRKLSDKEKKMSVAIVVDKKQIENETELKAISSARWKTLAKNQKTCMPEFQPDCVQLLPPADSTIYEIVSSSGKTPNDPHHIGYRKVVDSTGLVLSLHEFKCDKEDIFLKECMKKTMELSFQKGCKMSENPTQEMGESGN